MKRKFARIILPLMLLAMLALTGCGGKKKEVSVDPAALAGELKEKATSGELSSPAETMIPGIYNIPADSIASCAAYVGSGSTASEVCVIECTDESKVKDVIAAFESHVSTQSELYASYNAGEVDKLKNAVTASAGKYAVLCVPDDAKAAKDVLKSAGF